MHKRTYEKYSVVDEEEKTAYEQLDDYCSARIKFLGGIIFTRNTWLSLSIVLNIYLTLYIMS